MFDFNGIRKHLPEERRSKCRVEQPFRNCEKTTSWKANVPLTGRAKEFSLLQNVQICYGAHPVSYLVGTECFFPETKRLDLKSDQLI
jgi:hypothetical protein